MDMKTLYLCALFGGLGLVEDFIVTLYYSSVAKKKSVRAGVISTLHTLLAVFVVASIIRGDSIPMLVCYAVGGGVGCYLGVKHG
jgi:hypothetical protein